MVIRGKRLCSKKEVSRTCEDVLILLFYVATFFSERLVNIEKIRSNNDAVYLLFPVYFYKISLFFFYGTLVYEWISHQVIRNVKSAYYAVFCSFIFY